MRPLVQAEVRAGLPVQIGRWPVPEGSFLLESSEIRMIGNPIKEEPHVLVMRNPEKISKRLLDKAAARVDPLLEPRLLATPRNECIRWVPLTFVQVY